MSFIVNSFFAAPIALFNFILGSGKSLFSLFARFVPASLPSFHWRWSVQPLSRQSGPPPAASAAPAPAPATPRDSSPPRAALPPAPDASGRVASVASAVLDPPLSPRFADRAAALVASRPVPAPPPSFRIPSDDLNDPQLIDACHQTFSTIMADLPLHLNSDETTTFLRRLQSWGHVDNNLSYMSRALTYLRAIPPPLPRGFGIDLRTFTFRVPDNGDCFYIAIMLGMLFYPDLPSRGITEHFQLRRVVVEHLTQLMRDGNPSALDAIDQAISDYTDSERDKARVLIRSLPRVIADQRVKLDEANSILTAIQEDLSLLLGVNPDTLGEISLMQAEIPSALAENETNLEAARTRLALSPEEDRMTREDFLRRSAEPSFFAGAAEMYAIIHLFPTIHLIVQQANTRAYMPPYHIEEAPREKPHAIRLLLNNQHFHTGAPRSVASGAGRAAADTGAREPALSKDPRVFSRVV